MQTITLARGYNGNDGIDTLLVGDKVVAVTGNGHHGSKIIEHRAFGPAIARGFGGCRHDGCTCGAAHIVLTPYGRTMIESYQTTTTLTNETKYYCDQLIEDYDNSRRVSASVASTAISG